MPSVVGRSLGVRLLLLLSAEAPSQLIAKVVQLKEGNWVKMNKNCVVRSCLNTLK